MTGSSCVTGITLHCESIWARVYSLCAIKLVCVLELIMSILSNYFLSLLMTFLSPVEVMSQHFLAQYWSCLLQSASWVCHCCFSFYGTMSVGYCKRSVNLATVSLQTCLVSTHLFPQLWCDGKRNCDISAGLWHRGLGSGKWLVRVLPAVSSSCPGLSTSPPPNYSVPNGATRYCIKMLVSLFTYLLEPPASFLLCFLLIRSPEFLQAGSS